MHVYHIIYCNKTNRYVYVPLCVVLCSCPHCKAFLSFERHYTNQMYYYYYNCYHYYYYVSGTAAGPPLLPWDPSRRWRRRGLWRLVDVPTPLINWSDILPTTQCYVIL